MNKKKEERSWKPINYFFSDVELLKETYPQLIRQINNYIESYNGWNLVRTNPELIKKQIKEFFPQDSYYLLKEITELEIKFKAIEIEKETNG